MMKLLILGLCLPTLLMAGCALDGQEAFPAVKNPAEKVSEQPTVQTAEPESSQIAKDETRNAALKEDRGDFQIEKTYSLPLGIEATDKNADKNPEQQPEKQVIINGNYPLHVLAANGDKTTVRKLATEWCGWLGSHKLNQEEPSTGRTALHYAVLNKQIGSLVALLECSFVNTRTMDKNGNTPLHEAARIADFPHEAFLYLYRRSPKALTIANAKGETPHDILRERTDGLYPLVLAFMESRK